MSRFFRFLPSQTMRILNNVKSLFLPVIVALSLFWNPSVTAIELTKDGAVQNTLAAENTVITPLTGTFETLAPGDVLKLTVSGKGGDNFSGIYTVKPNNTLDLPYLPQLSIASLSVDDIEQEISALFIEHQFFKAGLFWLDIQVESYAAVNVTVNGAVFESGRVVINDVAGTSNSSGEILSRNLTDALLAAGGVTPYADIENIKITRATGLEIEADLSGLFNGKPIVDVQLTAGDTVTVPNTGKFQPLIVKPSPITPVEVATFVSNVTEPRTGKTSLETSDRSVNVTLFKYGTRLSQAAIAAQCAGGISVQNAKRKVLFIHTDESTGEVTRMERQAHHLLKEAKTEAEILAQQDLNPYLMPRDGIVCYDSTIVNLTSIFETVLKIMLPIDLARKW